MDTKKIGAFLKQCRKEKNLTQEQLAEKFGVSARTVSRWTHISTGGGASLEYLEGKKLPGVESISDK